MDEMVSWEAPPASALETQWDGVLSSPHPIAQAVRFLASHEARTAGADLETRCSSWVAAQLSCTNADVANLVSQCQQQVSSQLRDLEARTASFVHNVRLEGLNELNSVRQEHQLHQQQMARGAQEQQMQIARTLHGISTSASESAHNAELRALEAVASAIAELHSIANTCHARQDKAEINSLEFRIKLERLINELQTQLARITHVNSGIGDDLAEIHRQLASVSELEISQVNALDKLEDLAQHRRTTEAELRRFQDRLERRATRTSLARVEAKAHSDVSDAFNTLSHQMGRVEAQTHTAANRLLQMDSCQMQQQEAHGRLTQQQQLQQEQYSHLSQQLTQLTNQLNDQQLRFQSPHLPSPGVTQPGLQRAGLPTQATSAQPQPAHNDHVLRALTDLRDELKSLKAENEELRKKKNRKTRSPSSTTESSSSSDDECVTDEEQEDSCRKANERWQRIEKMVPYADRVTAPYAAAHVGLDMFITEWRRRLRLRPGSRDYLDAVVEVMIRRLETNYKLLIQTHTETGLYLAAKSMRLSIEDAVRLQLQLTGAPSKAFSAFTDKIAEARNKNRRARSSKHAVYLTVDSVVHKLPEKEKDKPRSSFRRHRSNSTTSTARGPASADAANPKKH